jgi:antitoxin VapB
MPGIRYDNVRQETLMRTVSIFRNNRNQAIRLPKEFEFDGVTELTIEKQGDTILLRPVRPSWGSFLDEPRADAEFLSERPDLIEEGRVSLEDGAPDRRA